MIQKNIIKSRKHNSTFKLQRHANLVNSTADLHIGFTYEFSHISSSHVFCSRGRSTDGMFEILHHEEQLIECLIALHDRKINACAQCSYCGRLTLTSLILAEMVRIVRRSLVKLYSVTVTSRTNDKLTERSPRSMIALPSACFPPPTPPAHPNESSCRIAATDADATVT